MNFEKMVDELHKGHRFLIDYEKTHDDEYHYVLKLSGNNVIVEYYVNRELFGHTPYNLKYHHVTFKNWQIWKP